MVDEVALVEFLIQNLRGAGFVTIQTQTTPPLTAEGKAALGEVKKVARVNGVINWQYQKAVNRQRSREGKTADFVAMQRKWGERLNGLPFVVHYKAPKSRNDPFEPRLNLEMKVERSLGHEYLDAEGNTIPREQVEQFLPAKGESRQDVDKEIILRDYLVQNITGMKINGIEV
jgi:hypothetical protein